VESGQDPEQAYLANLNGDVKNGPYSVTIYDNLYKGYSMPGKTTVALLFFCGYEPWKKFEEDYKREIKTEYYAEKRKWTDILIHRTEKLVIPGLSQMIEVQESATPLTNWRFTGNPNGAIYGSELTPENTFISRIKNRTPVKGLYLAGAWGYPGGGYSGVLLGSQNTFKCMMKDWASEQEMQGELISPV
jgi:prolycopene isomerase